MTPEQRRELDAIIERIRGTRSPLAGWRTTSLRTAARWIRECLSSSAVEAELEMDLRDLADVLEELAGIERRPPVEGRIRREDGRRAP